MPPPPSTASGLSVDPSGNDSTSSLPPFVSPCLDLCRAVHCLRRFFQVVWILHSIFPAYMNGCRSLGSHLYVDVDQQTRDMLLALRAGHQVTGPQPYKRHTEPWRGVLSHSFTSLCISSPFGSQGDTCEDAALIRTQNNGVPLRTLTNSVSCCQGRAPSRALPPPPPLSEQSLKPAGIEFTFTLRPTSSFSFTRPSLNRTLVWRRHGFCHASAIYLSKP